MKFVAITGTDDHRLTRGKTYQGTIVFRPVCSSADERSSLRVVVFDNLGQWMSFDPAVFVPLDGGE